MNVHNLRGKNWTARKIDQTYILSIADKSSIVDTLTDFLMVQKIVAGEITGIGATNEATLRFFDPDTKNYIDKTFTEQMEISNLSGNISEVGGKPMLHLHVTLGKSDYSALAGHLFDAKIRGAGEFFITAINNKVIKVKNEDIGLNFYDFENNV
ncbi:PPC domain-containing DNA-binding protein [Sphingobacterium arenae]|uniref:DNA-binding protein n=1 Tax=Sphingobacterium arenae TaxID=1280598 RepID=A0ABR7Y5A3_9SPHI|nr:PPC domain-containing DNA-binding protein [Sphingobacterium arenae]MBD1426500.1 DNA-binding protein [Sphingobacterium arenae]